MSDRKIAQLKELIQRHFSMPVLFVKKHQMMKSVFSYSKTINGVRVDVTPCGDHLRVCFNLEDSLENINIEIKERTAGLTSKEIVTLAKENFVIHVNCIKPLSPDKVEDQLPPSERGGL